MLLILQKTRFALMDVTTLVVLLNVSRRVELTTEEATALQDALDILIEIELELKNQTKGEV